MRRLSSRTFAIAIAVAAVAIGGLNAHADIAPDILGAGPGFEPPTDNPAALSIAMVKERVVLEVHDDKDGPFVVVDATFTMAAPLDKSGKAQKPTRLAVTFPGEGVKVGGSYAVHPRLYGFHAFVDGTPVATREEVKTKTTKVGPPDSTYTKTQKETWHAFPAAVDDNTVIRVRYAVLATPMTYENQTHSKVQYILRTGSLWAGTIGEAVVEVVAANVAANVGGANVGAGVVDVAKTSLRTMSMSPVSLVSLVSDGPPPPVMPAGAVRSASAITATWKNLEPGDKDDVEVVFPSSHPAWSVTPALATAMEKAAKN